MKNLEQYICHMPEFFSKNFCEKILAHTQNKNWDEHTWQTQKINSLKLYNDQELSVYYLKDLDTVTRNELFFRTMIAVDEYQMSNQIGVGVSFIHDYRINRYQHNNFMREHVDHIHDLFDGSKKGIPILSIIINLNEDYKGGELVFFEKIKYSLKTGDVIIFPSNFLYPHSVLPVVSGTRYSMVSWGY